MEKRENPKDKKDPRRPEQAKIEKSTYRYEKKNDRQGLVLGLSISGILLLVVCGILFVNSMQYSKENARLDAENQIMTQVRDEHDSLVNDWVTSMIDIEKELRLLQGKEEKLFEQSIGPEVTPSLRKEILAEIDGIHQKLDENRGEIARLTARLKQSGIKISSLNKQVLALEGRIASQDSSLSVLKNEVADKDFRLAEMNTVVDSLNGDITDYRTDLMNYEAVVNLQNEELNKAYIAQGNTKELINKGVIEKEGGILGLGRSKKVKEDLNDASFDRVKISDTRRIDLNARKASLISEHPASSYEVVETDSTDAYLEIRNPNEFWKITRYAVVETK